MAATSTSTARRNLTAALTALALIGGSAIATSEAAPAAAASSVNPFDAAGGYSIYARGDAVLGNAETEGAIAVGGTLAVRSEGGGYAVLHVSAGTGDYTLPSVDGDATRLLIGEFAETANGRVEVTGAGGTAGAVKIASDQPAFGFFDRDGWIRYRLVDATDADTPPLIDARGQAWPEDADAAAAMLRTESGSVADYVESGMTMSYESTAQCLANLADPSNAAANHLTVVDDVGDRVVLSELASDRPSVIAYDEIAEAGTIQFAGDVTPGAANPLIIRVAAGTTAISAPRTDDVGYARYTMWDLSAVTGSVTMTAAQSRIDGSVYAPFASVGIAAQPIAGQIIGSQVQLTDSSGEAHAYFFRGTIPCGFVPQQEGGFTVGKTLTGDAAELADDALYTFEYRIDGGAAVPLSLAAGEISEVVANLPLGTVVTVRESELPEIDGVVWGSPIWTVDGGQVSADEDGWVSVEITSTSTVAVDVTNVADPVIGHDGGFEITKSVVGDGASLLPDGTEFTVEYSSDGGTTIEELSIADGVTVAVSDLAPGTVLLRESDLPAVTGIDWDAPVWTIDGEPVAADEFGAVSLTITAGQTVEVQLTNTARQTEVDGSAQIRPTDPPSTPSVADPSEPPLASTGMDAATPLALAAAALLLGIAVLATARRRREQ